MADDTKSGIERKDHPTERDLLEAAIRSRVREIIETVVSEELVAALGAGSSVRIGEARRGYRHGKRERTMTTSLGPTTFTLPRARLFEGMAPRPSGAVRRSDGIGGGRRASTKRSWASI